MGIVTEGQGDPSAMVKEMTGVELPSYYNANAINPMKYAEGVRIYLQNLSKNTRNSFHEAHSKIQTMSVPH